MTRTNTAAVQVILGDNYDGTSPLDAYVEMATAIVDRVLTCAASNSVTVTDAEAELMERWMAAHYYTTMDPLYISKSTGRASGSFGARSYMDAALAVDPSGCLSGILTRGKSAGLSWLGKPKSAQINHADRN